MASPQSESYSGLSAWRRGGGRLPGPGSATSSSVGIQRTLERDKVEVGTFLFYVVTAGKTYTLENGC